MVIRLPVTPSSSPWLDAEVAKEEAEIYSMQLRDARKSGRYPFHVAAKLIAPNAGTGVSVAKIEERLILAARNRSLPVYRIGQNVQWDEDVPFLAALEIYWEDLNKWLEVNEPRLFKEWQFHGPEAVTTDVDASKTVVNKPGVPSAEIIEKFHLDDKWGNRLRHRKNYSYLKSPVLAQPGARGNGKGKNLWNPAQFAKMLVDRHVKNLVQMEHSMTSPKNHFDAWLDEWREISGLNDV